MKYGVRLLGSNYEVRFDGDIKLLGFITTRFVKAKSPAEAELKAVDLVRYDSRLNAMMVSESIFTATIQVEEMWEESWWKLTGGKGYTFFPMESEDEEI